jgi:hypothetical protein
VGLWGLESWGCGFDMAPAACLSRLKRCLEWANIYRLSNGGHSVMESVAMVSESKTATSSSWSPQSLRWQAETTRNRRKAESYAGKPAAASAVKSVAKVSETKTATPSSWSPHNLRRQAERTRNNRKVEFCADEPVAASSTMTSVTTVKWVPKTLKRFDQRFLTKIHRKGRGRGQKEKILKESKEPKRR